MTEMTGKREIRLDCDKGAQWFYVYLIFNCEIKKKKKKICHAIMN